MLKQSVTYKDFNDEEHTDDFYFHLSKVELVKMETSIPGGLSGAIQKIGDTQDNPDGKLIMDTFELFIFTAFGQRSEDGRRFLKSPELLEDFKTSGAYDAFFISIVTDAEAAAVFLQAIMPADMIEEVEALAKQQGLDLPRPEAVKVEKQIITKAELEEMSPELFADMAKDIAEGKVVVED